MRICGHCQYMQDAELTGPCPRCGHVEPAVPRAVLRHDPKWRKHPSAGITSAGATTSYPAQTRFETARERIAAGARGSIADAAEWAVGRSWAPRALILAYIAWAGFAHLLDPNCYDVTGWLTISVHEFGHFVTAWAPDIVCAAAGSVFQVIFPLYLVIDFTRHREYFGLSVAGFWLASSLFMLSAYVADARAERMLANGINLSHTEERIHDWNFILGQLGLLKLDKTFGAMIWITAAATLFASIGWGAWLCYRMFRASRMT